MGGAEDLPETCLQLPHSAIHHARPIQVEFPPLLGTQALHVSICVAHLDRILRPGNRFLGPILAAGASTEMLEEHSVVTCVSGHCQKPEEWHSAAVGAASPHLHLSSTKITLGRKRPII